MKRWVGLIPVILLLVAAGSTVQYWAVPLLKFLNTNSTLIEAIANAIQILLWVGAGFLILVRLAKKPTKIEKSSGREVGNRSVKMKGKKNIVTIGDRSPVTYIENQIVQQDNPIDVSALRQAYLNRVFETSRPLYLAGVDPRAASSDAESRLNLDAVYTALLTMTPELHEQMERGKAMEKEGRRQSALEQLNRNPRLALLGDPGSGKSTFVNFVALCLAGEALENKTVNLALLTTPLPEEEKQEKARAQHWDHGALLPVRITLRDFAARGLPPAHAKATAEHLWNFIVSDLQSAALDKYAPHLQQELLKTGGLLLLDGLDEVPEAEQRRDQIKQAVTDFAASYSHCRIIVTSRTYAYQKQEWRLPSFSEAVLAPFTRGQIGRFVERWYDHVASARGKNIQDARGSAEVLKRAIFNSERLLALAERPLLLTLMASLQAWRGGTLPEKREQLYADTVDLLLDWWESPKIVRDQQGQIKILQPSLAEWLQVDRQKVRDLLNELAYKAHSTQPELVGTADIPETNLTSGLLQISQNPDVKPARLVEYLCDRAGLLLPRGVKVYTFPHRTFQEYMTACYLTDHDYPEFIASLMRKDPNRWREVGLLAGAKAARGSTFAIWALAEDLCPHEPEPAFGLEEVWGAHLAAQALVESADLTKISERNMEKFNRIKRWLEHLLRLNDFPARERAAAGNNLATLGDHRLEVKTLDHINFCLVPAGKFVMGSTKKDDPDAFENIETPQTEIDLPEFYISRFPITNAQFDEFVKAGGYRNPDYWTQAKDAGVWKNGQVKGRYDDKPRAAPYDFGAPFNLPNHPVVGVTWYEALAFTIWLSEHVGTYGHTPLPEGWIVRLPSEAEWEKAARGGLEIPKEQIIVPLTAVGASRPDGMPLQKNPEPKRRYPWGDKPNPNLANYADTGIGATSAVGCFAGGASPYGCEEMSGNVWEWTRSLWGKNWDHPEFKYPYQPQDDRENLDAGKDVLRVLRGGAFSNYHWFVRCALRNRSDPDYGDNSIGFRVVLSPCF
jgi:formylglycine-generating enzyme required for sulfatase activity